MDHMLFGEDSGCEYQTDQFFAQPARPALTLQLKFSESTDPNLDLHSADREHSKLDPIFQQLRQEQETASNDKKSKHPLLVRAIWRSYKYEVRNSPSRQPTHTH